MLLSNEEIERALLLGKSYEDDHRMNLARMAGEGTCSVCGMTYDRCQSPPVELMDWADPRQDVTRLSMVRHGVLSGAEMDDEEKASFDLHYPS